MTINAQRVFVPKLNLHGYLVRVQPPSVPGGVTVFRVCWFEEALGGARREAGFWLEDMVFETVEEAVGV